MLYTCSEVKNLVTTNARAQFMSVAAPPAVWYSARLEVAGSNPANGCYVQTPTQCAISPRSVNEY